MSRPVHPRPDLGRRTALAATAGAWLALARLGEGNRGYKEVWEWSGRALAELPADVPAFRTAATPHAHAAVQLALDLAPDRPGTRAEIDRYCRPALAALRRLDAPGKDQVNVPKLLQAWSSEPPDGGDGER